LLLLTGDNGIAIDPAVAKMFPNRQNHDPADLSTARERAESGEFVPIGLLFQDASRPRYEAFTMRGLGMSTDEKLAALNREFDQFAV
jgi:hypothetical protein